METKFKKGFYIGDNDNQSIFLSAPNWDCGWYWGFGYLGNRNCHYHVDGLNNGKNQNLYDTFKEHFGNSLQILDTDLWTVCELFGTFYSLKETAEVLGRGGSHFTKNPIQDIIINKDEVKRINEIVLPKLFDALHDILNRFEIKKSLFIVVKNMADNNSDIPTIEIINFMFENSLTTDDLKALNTKCGGLSKDDYSNIHSLYWKTYHANKKQ